MFAVSMETLLETLIEGCLQYEGRCLVLCVSAAAAAAAGGCGQ